LTRESAIMPSIASRAVSGCFSRIASYTSKWRGSEYLKFAAVCAESRKNDPSAASMTENNERTSSLLVASSTHSWNSRSAFAHASWSAASAIAWYAALMRASCAGERWRAAAAAAAGSMISRISTSFSTKSWVGIEAHRQARMSASSWFQ